MEYTKQALGAAIRSHRKIAELTQAELATAADYREGGAVSISRIEGGHVKPPHDRLNLIAKALGTTVAVLESEAAKRSKRAGASPRGVQPLKERVAQVQGAVEERTTRITESADTFNAAHDRARDEFFMPFIAVARRIDGAPRPPDPTALGDEEDGGPEASAEYRLGISSAGVAMALGSAAGAVSGGLVGGAAAYGAFTTAAAFGTASTGAAISGLSGAAGTSATFAWFGGGAVAAGGAGVAGGTMVLAGMVAAPAAVLAIGGLVWMARRSKQKEAELLAKVERAEEALHATQSGYDALVRLLESATGILTDIAVHGGRAQKRWAASLGELPAAWPELTDDQQTIHADFVTIAACQLTVANINTTAILAAQGADQVALVEHVQQDLEHAAVTVDALV